MLIGHWSIGVRSAIPDPVVLVGTTNKYTKDWAIVQVRWAGDLGRLTMI